MVISNNKLKRLLEDIEEYLEELQRKENLSPWAVRERMSILKSLRDFKKENSALFEEKLGTAAAAGSDDFYDETCVPSTPQSPHADAPPVEDDLYEDTDMLSTIRSHSESVASEASSKPDDDDTDIKPIAAKEIENPQMSGHLEKKKKSDSKLKLFGGFKNNFVVLKDGVLYFYKKETDKAQKDTLNVEGYDFRSIPGIAKDKADRSIQLYCAARVTYEFLAPSKDECKKWKRAFDCVLGKNTADSVSTSEGTDAHDDMDGELYDEADSFVTNNIRVTPGEETYDDTVVQHERSAEPDWAKPPDEELYEDTDLAPPPSRPPKPIPQRSSLHPVPQPGPMDTYEDTLPPPPPPITEEIYDDTANPDEIYDDTDMAPPPPRPPQTKIPALPQAPVKPAMPLPPEPIQDEIYDDTEAPPPPPTSRLPKTSVPSRPPVPPPDDDGEDYDDASTVVPRRPPKTEISQYPGIEDYDRMYLSKWDHSSTKDDELSMKRGDMVCVVDKLYRDWWVGRIGSNVGLVPPVFLMKAYDLCIE